ncbi:MFS transporter [Lactobacillus sp. S2-2]|uniref:MFS transporter n=1 Tax=Lactobacillus sp. S2-2 TaxID=2692917 RepID=UPI001F0106F3|nr:MFS transporter [Lactobacillus sp. S2-2]MCF6514916.1 MFS transporter [Lactobacillus sp. S2-2]
MNKFTRVHHHENMTKQQKRVLASSSAGFGLENMDVLFLSFAMSSIMTHYHVSAGTAGLIGSITNWGMLLGGILFGIISDHIGRVKTFTYTIFIFAFATAAIAFASNIETIFILRFISGIGAGGEYGIGIALVAESFPKSKLGRISSITAIGGQAGALLAAILAAFIIPTFGWQALFLFGLIPVTLAFFTRIHLKESNEFKNIKYQHQNKGTIKTVFKYMFSSKKAIHQSLGLCIMTIVQIAGYFGMMNWLPKIVQEQLGLNVAGSSLWMISTIIGMSLGMLTFGNFLDKFGPRKAFGIFLIASAILVYTITLATNIYTMLIIGAVIGFFSNGMYGGYGAIVSRLYPTEIRATANNLIVGVGRAIGGFSSLIIGILMDNYNLTIVMLFLSTLYLISFITMLTLPGLKSLKPVENKTATETIN